jgi:peptide/nickel transport system ATP-binding protein
MISIEDLSVHYEDESALMEVVPESVKARFGWNDEPVRAVDSVSLDVEENDVVALVGESGSGKTTLGKAAVGLEEPTNGSVNYRGHDIWEVKKRTRVDDLYFEDVRRALQIVHQDPGAALNPFRTLMSMLKEPLNRWYPEMSDADRRERILGLFEECGLTPAREFEDRYPHELSGGEQQRVTLVRAMLAEPDLILADEPVSALDVSLRVELMDLMLELQEQFGTSFLFVSHNLEHARYIAKQADGRIAVMYLGEIVEIGPVDQVIQDPKHPYTKILKWATLPPHPDRAREAVQAESPLRQLDIPDIVNPPSGCRFHTRCPKARKACTAETPDLVSSSTDDHRVSCFRELSDHEYWDSQSLDEDGEKEIPS